MNSDKIKLRLLIRDEIAALPDDYIRESDKANLLHITSLREFIEARNIMIYHSVGKEPDTVMIAEAAFTSGKTVAFPYCYRGGIMEARVVTSLDQLKPAMLGIPAPLNSTAVLPPEVLDFVVVPALTYDKSGFRLGYGGGYYDRYLPKTPAFTAGLARQKLVRDMLPLEAHDVAVKCLITETGALRCFSETDNTFEYKTR